MGRRAVASRALDALVSDGGVISVEANARSDAPHWRWIILRYLGNLSSELDRMGVPPKRHLLHVPHHAGRACKFVLLEETRATRGETQTPNRNGRTLSDCRESRRNLVICAQSICSENTTPTNGAEPKRPFKDYSTVCVRRTLHRSCIALLSTTNHKQIRCAMPVMRSSAFKLSCPSGESRRNASDS